MFDLIRDQLPGPASAATPPKDKGHRNSVIPATAEGSVGPLRRLHGLALVHELANAHVVGVVDGTTSPSAVVMKQIVCLCQEKAQGCETAAGGGKMEERNSRKSWEWSKTCKTVHLPLGPETHGMARRGRFRRP